MALPESSSKEDQGKKTGDQEDKDFDPTPEALIDEIDDERTLEEEEALDANDGTAVQEELDDLKKESEMPIEELLAYYERMRNDSQEEMNSDREEDEDDEEMEDDEEEEEEEEDGNDGGDLDRKKDRDGKGDQGPRDFAGHNSRTSVPDTTSNQHSSKDNNSNRDTGSEQRSQSRDTSQRSNSQTNNTTAVTEADSIGSIQTNNIVSSSALIQPHQQQKDISNNLTNTHSDDVAIEVAPVDLEPVSLCRPRHPMTDFIIDDDPSGVFKTLLGYDLDDSDDMDEDYSCTDDENGDDERDWRRVIHVGADYQADIPEGLNEYDDLPPYENEDKLVWKYNPSIAEERLIEFLKQASSLSKRNDISISPASVPKISNDNMRLYRERMQDITSSTGSHISEHNHENNIILENTPVENLQDVYMSQSRKRARIDYELEQENAMDGINPSCGVAQNKVQNSKDENSDSVSQDTRPEVSTEEYFQDEEQLLHLLLQCNYNFDEAMRRRKLDPFKYYLYEPMSLWSQEECLGFEHGLRTFGKNFRLIREDQVQTRTHAEVVAFYYLWKKSERHDVYTNQYKLDRKRCLSHPGTTDYMDKFIEDNESAILNASSSSTPTPTDSSSKPKIKEFLVNLEDPTQKKLPGLLKAHPMIERNLDEPADPIVEIESNTLVNQVVEIDVGFNDK